MDPDGFLDGSFHRRDAKRSPKTPYPAVYCLPFEEQQYEVFIDDLLDREAFLMSSGVRRPRRMIN
jgi:hypothetical protein